MQNQEHQTKTKLRKNKLNESLHESICHFHSRDKPEEKIKGRNFTEKQSSLTSHVQQIIPERERP